MTVDCRNRLTEIGRPCPLPRPGLAIIHACVLEEGHDGLHECQCSRAWVAQDGGRPVRTLRLVTDAL